MRKRLTAVVLAVLVFSLIAASAASLGGINTADLGADSTIVAACDSDGVNVDYGVSYNPDDSATGPGYFQVDTVTVSAIDAACDGYDIHVTLTDGTNIVDSATANGLTSPSVAVTMNGTADAEAVTEVAIVIENGS